jgi:hypothetical protein
MMSMDPKDFDIFQKSDEVALPLDRLQKLDLVAVNIYDLEDEKIIAPATHYIREKLAKLLPGDRNDWVTVGFIHASYNIEQEGKWEYYWREETVFAHRTQLDQALSVWESEQSQGLKYNPFTALKR